PSLRREYVPAWTINIFKLQLGLVYFFAGVAKLNPDWLLNAMPLQIWLPANADLPIVGPLLEYTASAYIFSWAGAFYDLTIAFFLLWKRTRILAYVAVIGFHMFTWFLFQIGMFPFIMILCTLIFFSADFHKKVIRFISGLKTY
ncbi:MAG: HTTM domain-containing protein, partial [Phycisphaerae bacterium]|nr:HTTM domain-containing protein [Phycisphaerae bacterium]NIX00981.1 HTTM domain-containing protein [Phycisphaerae bacterium]NIX28241.1 HTTM domain-containing protein [Phycisphaerae bacterium]